MSYLGIEPRTFQLKAEYSTVELVTHVDFNKNIINIKLNSFYFNCGPNGIRTRNIRRDRAAL